MKTIMLDREKQTTLLGKTIAEVEEEKRLKEEEEDYPIEYILNYAKEHAYDILDIRCWPNGITKEEFMRKYEANFKDGTWLFGHAVNDGHFCFLIPIYKRLGGDPEVLWEVLEERITEVLKEHIVNGKRDHKQYLEWSKRFEKEGAAEAAKTWKEHAEEALKVVKLYEKELKRRADLK